MSRQRLIPLSGILLVLVVAPGCSIKKLAARSVANALAGGGDVFSSDEDPQLVREAVPFALKTYESLLETVPEHRPLLVATAAGFTQYAYGFVLGDAEQLEATDLASSLATRRRVRRLLLRARGYGFRALDLAHPGLTADLRKGRIEGLAATSSEDLGALYWTGLAWGAAIVVLKDDAELIGDLPAVEAMLRRVIVLDEAYDRGGAHEIMVTLEAGLAAGSLARAKEHFERAIAISGGHAASPFVTYAETVAVKNQDRALFDQMLERALAVDVNAEKAMRLKNLLAQERARWLKSRATELFVD